MNGASRPHGAGLRTWAISGLVLAFAMINFADKAVLGLVELPLSKELGLDHSTYGLVASSFFLLFSVSSVIGGFLANRVSARWLLLALALLWSLVQVPLLAAASLTSLFASRIALGATEGPAAAVATHAVLQWFPAPKRGLPSTFYTVGAGLGTFTAAPVLTWLVLGHGWRAAFLALTVVGVVWGALWLLVGRDGPYRAQPDTVRVRPDAVGARPDAVGARPDAVGARPDAVQPDTMRARPDAVRAMPSEARVRVPYRRLFTTPTFLGGTISGFGSYWALAIGSAFVPAYLVTQQGFTPAIAAAAVSVYAALYVIGPLLVSPVVSGLRARGVSSRRSTGTTQGMVVILAGASLLALPHASGIGTVFVLVAMAFGLGVIVFPLAYLTTGEVTPVAQRGASLGALIAIQSIPGLLGPAVTGWIIDAAPGVAAGYVDAFTAGGIIMVICGAVGVVTIRPERDAARLGLLGAPPIVGAARPVRAAHPGRE